MKIEEAKSVLQSYRANGADADDPAFSEALKLARSDPGLSEWFEKQQAFDRAMGAEYEAMPAPAGLLEKILAAADEDDAAPVRNPRRWWSRHYMVGLTAAAAVVVLVTLSVVLRTKPGLPAANSALAEFAIGDAQLPKTHGGRGAEAAALNRLLNKESTRLSEPLAADFAAMSKSGGRTVTIEGRPVLEVCFRRNGVGLHCYIARRTDFPTLTAPAKPVVTDRSGANLVTWTDTANLYIVVTKLDREALDKLL